MARGDTWPGAWAVPSVGVGWRSTGGSKAGKGPDRRHGHVCVFGRVQESCGVPSRSGEPSDCRGFEVRLVRQRRDACMACVRCAAPCTVSAAAWAEGRHRIHSPPLLHRDHCGAGGQGWRRSLHKASSRGPSSSRSNSHGLCTVPAGRPLGGVRRSWQRAHSCVHEPTGHRPHSCTDTRHGPCSAPGWRPYSAGCRIDQRPGGFGFVWEDRP